MSKVIAVGGKFAKAGAKNVDVLVHIYYVGQPSPCGVIVDSTHQGFIGGHINSLDEILQDELNKRPGYVLTEPFAKGPLFPRIAYGPALHYPLHSHPSHV